MDGVTHRRDVLTELWRGLRRQIAGPGQRYRQIQHDAAGPRRHDNDAVGQEDGFGNAVRHKDNGLAAFCPNPQQFDAEIFARDGVQRPKGLVQQEHFGQIGKTDLLPYLETIMGYEPEVAAEQEC